MGVTRGQYTQFRNYGTPRISGTGEARNEFGMRVDRGELTKKNEILGQWGSGGARDPISELFDPLVSRELGEA